MIITPKQLENNIPVYGDLCIIGSGPAAISIALLLKDKLKKIIIVSGGDWKETIANQDLHRGSFDPTGVHDPLEENRRRQLGGGTNVWGGRCIPFDPIDFEERSWIPNSGWPFSYDELLPFYKQAIKLCDAGEFNFKATEVFKEKQGEIINGFDNDLISSNHLERWSKPINFARDYEEELTQSENINILLNTHVTQINCSSKHKISSVTVNAEGKIFEVLTTRYVLATGGIENPRILLASKNKFYPNGVGNDRDVVGRYYMGHLMGVFATVDPTDRGNFIFKLEKDNEGIYCRRRWWITEKAQKNNKIGNAILFLNSGVDQNGHRDALFSAVFLAKSILSIVRQKSFKTFTNKTKLFKPALKEHCVNVLRNSITLAPQVANILLKRFSKRKLPFILPSIKTKQFGLYYQAEQVPNPQSRITLSDTEFDRFGMPRAVANIKFTDTDINTVIEAHKIFIDRFISGKFGTATFSEEDLLLSVKKRTAKYNSAAHHLGTTRISVDPSLGVVDSNCKVHGIDNLYIAGASVFPTGGHANPTLTLVALAAKLADHLNIIN